jgi:hypothetical protein
VLNELLTRRMSIRACIALLSMDALCHLDTTFDAMSVGEKLYVRRILCVLMRFVYLMSSAKHRFPRSCIMFATPTTFCYVQVAYSLE